MATTNQIQEYYEITEKWGSVEKALCEVLSEKERNLIPEKTNDSPAINVINSTPDWTDVWWDTIKHLKNES